MAFGNGTLAGLVAITSPCSTVYPWAAIIIGGVAGVLYCIGSEVRRGTSAAAPQTHFDTRRRISRSSRLLSLS